MESGLKKHKAKGEIEKKLRDFFLKQGGGSLQEVVTYVYDGKYTESGRSAVLKALNRHRKGDRVTPSGKIIVFEIEGLEIWKDKRGYYYSISKYKEEIKKALLQLRDEGYYIVTVETVRIKAGIESYLPREFLELLIFQAREELGIRRPSIGAIDYP